jgi:hypothetical protein
MFNNIKKERELLDRELAVYKKEKLAEITLDIAEAQELGAKQERDYECTWHSRKEALGIEIAKLEATKESYVSHLEKKLENYISEYNVVCRAKDKTIEVLENTIKELIQKMPTNFNSITTNNK